MLQDIDTKQKVANASYKAMEELDFQMLLSINYYVNSSSIHICFPMKTKKLASESTDIDDDLIAFSYFFGHLVEEIRGTKYGSDKELIPTFSPYEVYQFSDSVSKHLSKDPLAKIEKTLLHSKKNSLFKKKSPLIEEFTMVREKRKLQQKGKMHQT